MEKILHVNGLEESVLSKWCYSYIDQSPKMRSVALKAESSELETPVSYSWKLYWGA